MKKVIVMLAVLAIAGSAMAIGITGTAHDFSADSWNASGEICITCHTPHNSDTAVSDAPLWNHAVTAASFTAYSSTTLNATMGAPDGVSKLCLSCHDGTVGLDDFGGATPVPTLITGNALVGTDLSNDHPISFTYNAALVTADGGLNAITATSNLGGTIEADLLFGGNVECASCHDVHDDSNGAFLRMDNAASALCLTCHNK